MGILQIKCHPKYAPSYFTQEESEAWAKGARHGAGEMRAAIMMLCRQYGADELAEKIKAHTNINTTDEY
jgi:hypothetical protein